MEYGAMNKGEYKRKESWIYILHTLLYVLQ